MKECQSQCILLLGVLALTMIGVARAQEGAQTVENAQRFLSIVLPGNGYMKGGAHTALDDSVKAMRQADPQNYYDGHIYGEATIVDASVVSSCKSKLLSDYSNVEVEIRARRAWNTPILHRRRAPIMSPEYTEGGSEGIRRHGAQEGFPWSDVKSVKADGDNVKLMVAGNKEFSTIYLRSSDLAGRVAYAIEFLRTQCDPAAGTGF